MAPGFRCASRLCPSRCLPPQSDGGYSLVMRPPGVRRPRWSVHVRRPTNRTRESSGRHHRARPPDARGSRRVLGHRRGAPRRRGPGPSRCVLSPSRLGSRHRAGGMADGVRRTGLAASRSQAARGSLHLSPARQDRTGRQPSGRRGGRTGAVGVTQRGNARPGSGRTHPPRDVALDANRRSRSLPRAGDGRRPGCSPGRLGDALGLRREDRPCRSDAGRCDPRLAGSGGHRILDTHER